MEGRRNLPAAPPLQQGSEPPRQQGATPPLQQGPGLWPGYGGNGSSDFSPQQQISPQNPWGYPQGGFVNFIQQPYCQASQGENFHFTGMTNQSFNDMSPDHCLNEQTTREEPSAKETASRKKMIHIDIDDDDSVEGNRAKKRWTHNEEIILANAWLNSSNDSVNGNDKKGEIFWKQITEEYNKKVPENRRRVSYQLQVHWSRLKTSINDFNGFWSTVCKVHTSGYSEEQLMDEAQKMYASKNGKPFTLIHWWRTLRKEPKWCAYVERMEKDKNRGVTIDLTDGTAEKDLPRPIGREAAKAQLRGKRKKEVIMEGISVLGENINKMVEMQKERKLERDKVSEAQLEISRTNLKAAKEQNEARLYEVYNSLLTQDTSKMTEREKTSREKTLEKLEAKLFGPDDDAQL